jgi:non-specific serine/threonine protein kinase/serine/threonine-protein kinase
MSDADRTTRHYPADPADFSGAQVVHGYRIVSKLGEGGMGEVFRALQTVPFERVVALKIVRRGLESPDALSRLESERQALAMMGHPCIACVFDAGITEDGRPFFVMELVSGAPITEYCDTHRLPVDDRIRLFLKVCEGIHHAHQKGIIHRDIKPSNVLVREEGGVAHPKLIDFGIAKAIGLPLVRGPRTQVGQIVGTPEYMSPEQAGFGPADVDIRTDVYSLGVLLYELLVGVRPFSDRDSRLGLDELLRRIRETDPPRASSQVGTGEELSATARSRCVTVNGLRARLRGDLDWITGKALDRDRTRRYQSVLELVADLRRHLDGEPVLAGPPGATYRIRKFVRRHRIATAVAVTGLLGLLAVGLATGYQARRLARERDRARQEAETAREVTEFLVDVFRTADPIEGRGANVTARELLDQGAARIRGSLAAQPSVRVRVMTAIGTVYDRLGLYGSAEALLAQAIGDAEGLGPSGERTRAGIKMKLASALRHRGNLAQAEALLDQAIGYFDSQSDAARERAMALGDLGELYWEKNDYARSRSTLERAVNLATQAYARDTREVATMLNDLGLATRDTGDPARALSHFQESSQIFERLYGASSPELANTLGNIAFTLIELHRTPEAVQQYERALAIDRKTLGDAHPTVARLLAELGYAKGRLDDYPGARKALHEAIPLLEASLGSHVDTARAIWHLGDLEAGHANFAEGLPLLQRATDTIARIAGTDSWQYTHHAVLYATELNRAGRNAEAVRLYHAYGERELEAVKDRPDMAPTLTYFADALCETRPDPRGLEMAQQALGRMQPSLPAWAVLLVRSVIAVCDPDRERFAPNEAALTDALRAVDASQGSNHRRTRDVLRRMSAFYRHWGKASLAEQYRQVLASREAGARREAGVSH